jgi:hypothetical protein
MAGTGVKLERPDVKYQTSFIAAVHEFRANGSGLEDLRELELVNLEKADFVGKILRRSSREKSRNRNSGW